MEEKTKQLLELLFFEDLISFQKLTTNAIEFSCKITCGMI